MRMRQFSILYWGLRDEIILSRPSLAGMSEPEENPRRMSEPEEKPRGMSEPEEKPLVGGTVVASRTLKVLTHVSEYRGYFMMEVNSGTKYKEVKECLVLRINLNPSSLIIFGLFKVYDLKYHPLMELCNDEDTLPEDVNYVAFRRLCFDKELEQRIVAEDEYAMKLFFWESHYFIRHGTFLEIL